MKKQFFILMAMAMSVKVTAQKVTLSGAALKIGSRTITAISNDSTAGEKNSNALITSRAAKLYAESVASTGGGWGLAGNTGTTPGTNFIGTTDDKALIFKVRNTQFMRLHNTNNHISIGEGALVPTQTGLNCIAIGYQALNANVSGNGNIAIGYQAGLLNTTRKGNCFFGWQSGQLNQVGEHNTYYGTHSGQNVNIGNENVAIGSYALQYSDNAAGKLGQSTVVGTYAAFQNPDRVTAIGYFSRFGTTPGNFNGRLSTSIGYRSLVGVENDTSVTAIGDYTVAANGLNNATAIGSKSYVSASNCLVLGSINGVNGATANTSVGIGTSAPSAQLHTTGTVKFTGLSSSNNGDDSMMVVNNSTGMVGKRAIPSVGASSDISVVPFRIITGNDTLRTTDYRLIINAGSTPITLYVPSSATATAGKTYIVSRKNNTSTGSVQLTPLSGTLTGADGVVWGFAMLPYWYETVPSLTLFNTVDNWSFGGR